MKVNYSIDSVEYEGHGSRLSLHGVFVESTTQPAFQQTIVLRLIGETSQLQLGGQVVCGSTQGFGVMFTALAPADLRVLYQLLKREVPTFDLDQDGLDAPLGKQVTIQLLNWAPKVDEQPFHEFTPDVSLSTPPRVGDQATRWRSLATISPTITLFGTTLSDTQQTASAAGRGSNTSQNRSDQTASKPAEQSQIDKDDKVASAQPERTQPNEQSVDTSPVQAVVDRRQTVRHERSIPVSFENLTGLIKEFTHNISYGGMFVYSTQPQQQNTQTAVTLIHPVHGERLTLDARVVHASQAPTPDPQTAEPRYGLGLEFALPLEELKKVLADFIGSHQKQDQKNPDQEIVQKAKQMLKRGEQSGQALLGVAQDASKDAIRQAYFKLVDEFHPDRYFGKIGESDRKILEQLFRQATKAYEDLTA